ncbi:MAG: acetyl-CoA hydrolase/transferase C-terminal domain-containing protein [Saprospiraceae bacterium]
MVDFTGQVASESIGMEQYSGTGGQTDTALGAIEGLDGKGKSIMLVGQQLKMELFRLLFLFCLWEVLLHCIEVILII